jgi:drug/metabolite transporter (DMT)-like permease
VLRIGALTGIIGISFSAIFVRLADVSPVTTAFFRVVYALPLLGLIWAVQRRKDARPLRDRGIAVAAGVVFTADLVLWHTSIGLIGAGLATVLANTQIVFVGIAAWVIHRERPSTMAIGAVPVILGGVLLIAGVGGTGYGDDPARGALYGLLTGLTYAAFIVLLRAANRAPDTPPAGPLLDATLGSAVSLLAVAPFEADFSFSPSWPAHGWLILLAIVAQTVGWLLVSRTLPRLPALETSLLILVQPAGTLVWARLVFGEAPSATQWIGVAVVLVGVTAAAGRTTVRRSGEATPRRI